MELVFEATREPSDVELAHAARDDARAFGRLYERHRTAVYRYARSRVDSDDEAADLTATTFERAFAAIGRYRAEPDGPLPWLLRIARNAAIDANRRRRPVTSLHRVAEPVWQASGASAEEGAMSAEAANQLRAIVAGLADPARDAIVLRYASGLTAREIGAVIGRSEEATQKLLSRALATIREAYRD
jgi:RNA polymerase sigma-70 factor (ECF subfamily)